MPPLPEGHHGEKPGETMARFIVEQMLCVRVCCFDDRRHNMRPDAIVHRQGGVPLEIKELHKLEDVLLRLEDPAQSDSVPRRTDEYEFIRPLPGIPAGQVRFSIGSGGGYPIPDGAGLVAAASVARH